MFGVGLPTPPECLTEGLPRTSSALASRAFLLSEHSQKEGDLSVGHSCGVRRPAHNKLDEAAIFDAARQFAAADARPRYIEWPCGGDPAL